MFKKGLSICLCVVMLLQLTGCQALRDRFVVEEPVETTAAFGVAEEETEEEKAEVKEAEFLVSKDFDVSKVMSELGVITNESAAGESLEGESDAESGAASSAESVEGESEAGSKVTFSIADFINTMDTQNFGDFTNNALHNIDEEERLEAEAAESLAAEEAAKAAASAETAESGSEGESAESVEETVPEVVYVEPEAEEEAGIRRANKGFRRILGNGVKEDMEVFTWINTIMGYGFIPSRLAITTTYLEDGYTIEQAESIAPVTPGEVVDVGVVLNQKYLAYLMDIASNESVSHTGYLVSFTLADNPEVVVTVGEANRFDRLTGELECMYVTAEVKGNDDVEYIKFGQNEQTWADMIEANKDTLNYHRLESGLYWCDINREGTDITSLKFTNYKSQEMLDYLSNFTSVAYNAEDDALSAKMKDLGKVYWNNRTLDVNEIVEIRDLVVALDKLALFGYTPSTYKRNITGTWNVYAAPDYSLVKKIFERLKSGERDEYTISLYLVKGNTDDITDGNTDIQLDEDGELVGEESDEVLSQSMDANGDLVLNKGSEDNIIGAEYTVLVDRGQIMKTELSINRVGLFTETYKVGEDNELSLINTTYKKCDEEEGVTYTKDKLSASSLSGITEGMVQDPDNANRKYLRSEKYMIAVETEESNSSDIKSVTFTRYWR